MAHRLRMGVLRHGTDGVGASGDTREAGGKGTRELAGRARGSWREEHAGADGKSTRELTGRARES